MAALATACSEPVDQQLSQATPTTPLEAVLIYVPAGGDSLSDVEGHLYDALAGTAAGRVAGSKDGPNGAVIELNGPDADRLLRVVKPALAKAPLPEGTYVVKRYGGPGAQEKREPLG